MWCKGDYPKTYGILNEASSNSFYVPDVPDGFAVTRRFRYAPWNREDHFWRAII